MQHDTGRSGGGGGGSRSHARQKKTSSAPCSMSRRVPAAFRGPINSRILLYQKIYFYSVTNKRLGVSRTKNKTKQAFYENVVRGFIARGKGNEKEPLYTQVAVIPSPAADGPNGATGGDGGASAGDGHRPWPPSNGSEPSAEGFPADGDDDRLDPGGTDGTGQNPTRRHSPPAAGGGGGGGGPTGAMADDPAAGIGGRSEGAARSSRLIWPPAAGAGGGIGPVESGAGEGRDKRESVVGLITCQVSG